MNSTTNQLAHRLDALKRWVAEAVKDPIDDWRAMPAAASTRRFYRVVIGSGTMVAMDAPPPEDNAEFVRLARLFKQAGVAVPEIIDVNLEDGFLLVSDLGSTHLADIYGGPDTEAALEAALNTLVTIQSLPASEVADLPPYTSALCASELQIFTHWLLDGLLQIEPPPLLDAVFARLIDSATGQPQLPMHRDFHCKNLLWADDASLRVVDFQGALIGPASYDLCSLLRDCYWRFSETEIHRWRDRYLDLAASAGVGRWPAQPFAQWLDWMALQRQLKALGIFVRLKLRDGRDTHLADIAPVLGHAVDIARQYDALRDFGDWLAEVVQPGIATHPETAL